MEGWGLCRNKKISQKRGKYQIWKTFYREQTVSMIQKDASQTGVAVMFPIAVLKIRIEPRFGSCFSLSWDEEKKFSLALLCVGLEKEKKG